MKHTPNTHSQAATQHDANQFSCTTSQAAHRRSTLIQDGIGRIVEQQASHSKALLLSSTECLRPVLHLIPPLAPAQYSHVLIVTRHCSRLTEFAIRYLVLFSKTLLRSAAAGRMQMDSCFLEPEGMVQMQGCQHTTWSAGSLGPQLLDRHPAALPAPALPRSRLPDWQTCITITTQSLR